MKVIETNKPDDEVPTLFAIVSINAPNGLILEVRIFESDDLGYLVEKIISYGGFSNPDEMNSALLTHLTCKYQAASQLKL